MDIVRRAGLAGSLVTVLVLLVGVAAPALAVTVDAQTRQALIDAMHDEYQARAFYQAVIAKFGWVRPFANIVRSEEQHVSLLRPLFEKYGITVPADTFAAKAQAPGTLREACAIGVKAEQDNIALYERFLAFVKEPDIITVFTHLRDASANAHLPAFSRCAN
ncbi:MAG: DUF2202 domain-containing protein [Armatimonadota bacterium]|nr:DUF2202 domain-containing protein [Armatimonadota bacterium]